MVLNFFFVILVVNLLSLKRICAVILISAYVFYSHSHLLHPWRPHDKHILHCLRLQPTSFSSQCPFPALLRPSPKVCGRTRLHPALSHKHTWSTVMSERYEREKELSLLAPTSHRFIDSRMFELASNIRELELSHPVDKH